MCLLENENGVFRLGFCIKKGVIGCWIQKKIGPFSVCEHFQIGGHLVLILSNLSENLPFLAENWQNFQKIWMNHAKIGNFTLTCFKKGVIGCGLKWKTGSLGVRFTLKKCFFYWRMILADMWKCPPPRPFTPVIENWCYFQRIKKPTSLQRCFVNWPGY